MVWSSHASEPHLTNFRIALGVVIALRSGKKAAKLNQNPQLCWGIAFEALGEKSNVNYAQLAAVIWKRVRV